MEHPKLNFIEANETMFSIHINSSFTSVDVSSWKVCNERRLFVKINVGKGKYRDKEWYHVCPDIASLIVNMKDTHSYIWISYK